MDVANMKFQLDLQMEKFHTATHQFLSINNQITALNIRIKRAIRDGRRGPHYQHYIKLSALEGLQGLIHKYMRQQGKKIQKLEEQLLQATECEL